MVLVKRNIFIISIALNVIFVCLTCALVYHKRDKIAAKLEALYLGGANLQKQLWPNLIRVS